MDKPRQLHLIESEPSLQSTQSIWTAIPYAVTTTTASKRCYLQERFHNKEAKKYMMQWQVPQKAIQNNVH